MSDGFSMTRIRPHPARARDDDQMRKSFIENGEPQESNRLAEEPHILRDYSRLVAHSRAMF